MAIVEEEKLFPVKLFPTLENDFAAYNKVLNNF